MDIQKFFSETKIENLEDLKLAKNQFFGKDSFLAKLQLQLKTASPEEKRELGKQISELKNKAEIFFNQAAKKIEEAQIEAKISNEWLDIHSFSNTLQSGLHPLSLIENKLRFWLISHGYYEVQASEIETDEYNFERLNIAKNHPARQMQDSLYFNKNLLLRTHNTGVSARELEKNQNQPFAQFTIGKVFRNDEEDRTHSHQFRQLDLVAVGNLSLTDLMGTIQSLLDYVFEEKMQTRFRPSFFPFTEPSLEVDIFYNNQWIEILGCGMMHPKVLKMAGYTNEMQAIAAGIGIERLAMIKFGITDIREFYKNDLRFLKQF